MSEIALRPSLTKMSVENALARARAGEAGEIKDGQCKGLSLRLTGRKAELDW